MLYEEDLVSVLNTAQTPDDSLRLRESYVRKWVQDEVLFQHALQNLSDSLKNKDELLDIYYRSLIRYEYERGLINQRHDTSVTRKEIIEYYEEYKESFILEQRVCKAIYLRVPPDAPKQDIVLEWLAGQRIEDLDSLNKYCVRYGANFNVSDNKWFYLDDVLTEMQLPLNFSVSESQQPFQVSDSTKTSILKVLSLRQPGEQMPLPMASGSIRAIIKNKGKVEFINKMEKDVLSEAEKKRSFEIYE